MILLELVDDVGWDPATIRQLVSVPGARVLRLEIDLISGAIEAELHGLDVLRLWCRPGRQ